ncbi:MAG: putative beta-lysine N-acetyltransferase [Candidatus Methanoperedens sp.]|nr:putative beta-lysine N-acetyltransferase [Candidatus Methanoperedens sp.]
MNSDKIDIISNSILQHGKYNDRIYLMKLSKQDFPGIIGKIERLALDNGYTKIFAKVPGFAKNRFIDAGYLMEAFIPGFYNGSENAYLMGKYFSGSRKLINNYKNICDILDLSYSKSAKESVSEVSPGFGFQICDISNIPDMVEIYRKVFKTYPFPIFKPGFIKKTMNENVIYFSIWKDGKIAAISSSEMDIESKTVEMTDFATLPEYQGNGLAIYLLGKMENEMRKRDMKISYTIARASCAGINIIFAKSGYTYCGTLFNNTNISGSIESMNVWYKCL